MDLERFSFDAPPGELLDGVYLVRAPHRYFHQRFRSELGRTLEAQLPAGWELNSGMAVRLGDRDQPEPDLTVCFPGVATTPDTTYFRPEHIALAVEIVSPESGDRDREVKPRKFAQAGIAHYWRIEEDNGKPVVYAYELDRDLGRYTPVAVERERLKLDRPYPLEIELGKLYP